MNLPPAMKGNECRDALVEYKRTGDIRARNRAAAGCMRFVMLRARHYGRNGRNIDDLMQAGCEGLLRSFETYDASKGAPLTHAKSWVNRFIVEHIQATKRIVQEPANGALVAAVKNAIDAGAGTFDEMADATRGTRSLGMRMDTVAGIARLVSGRDIGDEFVTLASNDEPADVASERLHQACTIEAALAALSDRQREVIERMYWAEETGAKIAADTGVTRQRVMQIERAALKRLRKRLQEVA